MSKAIVIRVDDKTFFAETDLSVEVNVTPATPIEGVPDGLQPVVNLGQMQRDLAEVKDLIVASCNGLFQALESLPSPDKFAIEFGVKLAGEAGVPMLTKASGEANFKVSIEWKKG